MATQVESDLLALFAYMKRNRIVEIHANFIHRALLGVNHRDERGRVREMLREASKQGWLQRSIRQGSVTALRQVNLYSFTAAGRAHFERMQEEKSRAVAKACRQDVTT